jgi:uncharacterized membrane protein YhaH (DUF805 family)
MGPHMNLSQFYLSPKGRIGRADWWLKYFLVLIVIIVVAGVLDSALGFTESEDRIGVISVIAWLVMIYPAIVVNIKRFHDRNPSGWWVLIALIPLVGALWTLIECGFLRGTVGDNRYGPDPDHRLRTA